MNFSYINEISGLFFFFFQAEDGIRDLVRSRGLGDVYKRQFLLRRLWIAWTLFFNALAISVMVAVSSIDKSLVLSLIHI